MRVTIISSDKSVYIDGTNFASRTLVGIPPEVHALQWLDVAGWIEYNDGRQNESIDVLPAWAIAAIAESVFPTQKPPHDAITQTCVETAATQAPNGHHEQQWIVVALAAETIAANQANAAKETREAAKATRQAAVEAITVTTQSGNTFDGDETSQTRMVRAIVALQATGTSSVNWVLADNTVVDATASELTEALALAGAAQAAIWVI